MVFCPKCGKKGVKGFCRECLFEEVDLGFKDIGMIICSSCKKYKSQNRWVAFKNLDDAVSEFALSKIKNHSNIELNLRPIIVDLKPNPGVKRRIEIEVQTKDEVFMIPAILEFTLCEKCGKAGTEYLEGILQLRDVKQEIIDFVYSEVEANRVGGVHITKATPLKNGIDLQITSKKFLRVIGKKLKLRFNGELKENAKLFSRDKQKSKHIYRLNVLFKGRKYKIGEVIEKGEQKIKIKSLGQHVCGVDIDTGKKVFVE